MTDLGARPLDEELLEVAAAGDVDRACALVRSATTKEPLEELLLSLARVQRTVGERWAAGQWTIADEHRASAVADAALGVIERTNRPTVAPAGRICLVCVEHEWHTLPGRLAAEWLRLSGWSVDFLGGSLPSTVLAQDLARRRPDVVAVSCSVPDQLFGARRSISAATKLHLPVIAGGAAFGTTPRRSQVLGAAAWAAGGRDIARAASTVIGTGDHPVEVDPNLELRGLEVISHRNRMVGSALDDLRRAFPHLVAPGSEAEERMADDLRSIVRYAAAALLVDDQDIFLDFIVWFTAILAVRDVSEGLLDAGLVALLSADAPPLMVTLLERGRERIAGTD